MKRNALSREAASRVPAEKLLWRRNSSIGEIRFFDGERSTFFSKTPMHVIDDDDDDDDSVKVESP